MVAIFLCTHLLCLLFITVKVLLLLVNVMVVWWGFLLISRGPELVIHGTGLSANCAVISTDDLRRPQKSSVLSFFTVKGQVTVAATTPLL